MNYVITLLSVVFFSLFSYAIFAADIPQDVIGSEKFDAMKCISENTQTCINSICLNSEEIDCQSNCQKTAQEKCQQQINE
ncbi:hypothetical protein [Legionella maioricensis]|uniref:Transmembrane protein n=1 Tax=Legionella maioricensis TaxID=2896528 RepID=A0A9X2D158_9GAMM|nr:hypothetical protein [Legionella maioricensis]MCL9684407.1 hypothetical protein [Legionella maioricensis]MCL9687588.1 hypothetical protein [Legionella maioricensis]